MRKYFAIAAIILVSTGWTGAAQPRQTVESKDVSVLGFKLHYLEAGKGAPVVLLHGLGGDGSRWGPNIEPLAKDFHVFALDQIGFGQSDKPLTTYHSGVFAEFLGGFMKAIGVPKATLIGQSMGANVALTLAVQHPEMVNRLVLVNGGGFRTGPRTTPPDYHARQIANAATLAESREYMEKLYYDHSFVTDKLVEQNLMQRLRSAYTPSRACRSPPTVASAA